MASAIQSVEGAKVVVAPKRGTGPAGETIAIVELGGKANLAAVTAAVEAAQTPHRGQSAPDVDGVLPGKVKAGTTPEQIADALKKANLMEE